jgi:hypothetical protein
MNPNYGWQELYRSAVLELQLEDLPQRISAAENAIQRRITELRSDDSGAAEEYIACDDALRMLRFLAVTECKPPNTTAGGTTPKQAAS